ncbi:MAG: hypothetical protein Q8R40_06080, partial [bacterium]|nr:hypothetical protein [bacterium]
TGEASKREKSVIVYNADGSIDFTNSTFTGDLETEDTFTGREGKEKIQQTISYYNNEIVERQDYIYENGKLASSKVYDTDGLSQVQARQREAGLETELRMYEGRAGYEKLTWSSTYGDISAGEISLIDPNSSEFIATMRDLESQGKAVFEYYGNGKILSITISAENRVYEYTRDGTGALLKVEEKVNSVVRSAYIYTGTVGNELLNLSNNSLVTTAYTYESGRLTVARQFKDVNINNVYDAGDILKSEITYSGTKGNERISGINKYLSDGSIKSNSAYLYNLDAANGGDGNVETLDKVIEYYGDTQINKKEEYIYYKDGVNNTPKREKILESISYRTDGSKKSDSIYEYNLAVASGGDGDLRTLDKVVTYFNTANDWSGTTYKKNESFYDGRESKEKIVQMIRYNTGEVAIEETEYKYDVDADGGLDEVSVYKLGTSGSRTLRSKSFYLGYEGEEIVNKSYKYQSDGSTVKETTFYLYNGRLASDPNINFDDAMSTSEVYRGELNAPDAAKTVSRTFYNTRFGKGEEIAIYTHTYDSLSTQIRTTTFYSYNYKPAIDPSLTSDDAMTSSEVYRGEWNNVGSAWDARAIISRTFYEARFGKGEEIASYTHKIRYGTNTEIINTTFYKYDGKLATNLSIDPNDAMNISETYRGEINVPDSSRLRTKTYYFTGFGKGDEIADYSENYRADGITVSTVSVFFYGVTKVRAVAAGIDDSLAMSETHRDTITGLLRSKTYYLGAKGDEIADYSENFRADGITVSTVSVFFYGVTKVRAVAAGIDDALAMSETHRDTIDGLLRSKTYYLGAKSDEIADYSENFRADGI